MGFKNDYTETVEKFNFDRGSLKPGDVAFRVVGFREGMGNSGPVINLKLELHWSANEDDQDHLGKTLEQGVFFGGQNGALTVRQLKDFAKNSGFNINEWTADNNMPLGQMLAGFLKMLAVEEQVIQCKIVAGKQAGAGNFLNFTKVLRDDPGTGEPLTNRLPDAPVPHSVILEAIDADLPDSKTDNTPF